MVSKILKFILIVWAIAYILSHTVYASEDSPLHFSELQIDMESGLPYYVMEGEFTDASVEVIREFLAVRKGELVNIVASSQGGYANDILEIFDLVQDHGNVWFNSQPGNCLSSCAFMAAAGRHATGVYFFHSIHRTTREGYKLPSLVSNREMINRLVSIGWDRYTAEQALANVQLWYMVIVKDYDYSIAEPTHGEIYTEYEIAKFAQVWNNRK